VIAGVGGVCGIGQSDISPHSSNFLFLAWVGLPPGFCYVCVCVGLAHLVFYGRENKHVKCRNG
jgi:hypothetical protein